MEVEDHAGRRGKVEIKGVNMFLDTKNSEVEAREGERGVIEIPDR